MTFARPRSTRRLVVILAISTLLAVAPTPIADAETNPTMLPESVGHAGRWLIDESGRVLIPRGMNLIDVAPPYDPLVRGFGDADAQLMADAGFTTMRIGPQWVAAEPEPGRYDETYLAGFVDLVHLLNRHGMTPLIDFHQDNYGPAAGGEDGAPAWATLTDGLSKCLDPLGIVPCQTTAAWDHFWANALGPGGIGLQDRYAAYVAHVVRTLNQADVRVLGYDMMNEPQAGSRQRSCLSPAGCPDLDRTQLAPMYRRVITAVRAVDPTSMLFYEPLALSSAAIEYDIPDLGDDHLGLSFHTYCPTFAVGHVVGTTVPGQPICLPFEDRVFDNAENQARRTGDALLMTEFGSSTELARQTNIVELADERMVGWMEWTYWNPINPRGYMLVGNLGEPRTGDNLDHAKLDVLTRPYPRAVAGTPTSYRYDVSTGIFTLSYTTTRADGTGRFSTGTATEIATPAGRYPHGYDVTITGGTIDSAPDAGVLRIATEAGATAVEVTVRPKR